MLNKISTICSSVFLIIAFITPGFADEHFPFLAEVSKESVNVRAGPNTNFEKIDKLNKGAQVVVLGRSYEWYKIQPLPTTKSYIRSDYLKIKEGSEVGVVLGDNVNIRSSAKSDAASLGELKKGTLVKVLGHVEETGNGLKKGNLEWCLLSPVPGTMAWVHQDFLKKVSEDVPSVMLIPTVQWPLESPVKQGNKVIIERISLERVSLQGKLQALPIPAAEDVHYEIAIDNKSIYYLQDMPQLLLFANAVVSVEGIVIPQKKLMHPLLHINKISLVL